MSITQTLTAYIAASTLLTITPGLDTALVLRTAATEGRGSAVYAGAGICAGCLTWGIAASLGVGAVFTASSLAFAILRAAGAGYLVFLALKLLLRPERQSSQPIGTECCPLTEKNWFGRGLYTNLLNPKVGIFYVTFLPQFIPTGVSPIRFSMLLASIHATEGALWFAALIVATTFFSRWLRQPAISLFIDRVTAGIFLGFGAKLALLH